MIRRTTAPRSASVSANAAGVVVDEEAEVRLDRVATATMPSG
jgi:hypothetical protein